MGDNVGVDVGQRKRDRELNNSSFVFKYIMGERMWMKMWVREREIES